MQATTMRHYEIVVMIHPKYEDQVEEMIKRYRNVATQQEGKIHRFEDWGRIPLAYVIQNACKAHFLLFNIECVKEVYAHLLDTLKRNDAVMRHMVLSRKKSIIEPSAMYKKLTEEKKPTPTKAA